MDGCGLFIVNELGIIMLPMSSSQKANGTESDRQGNRDGDIELLRLPSVHMAENIQIVLKFTSAV